MRRKGLSDVVPSVRVWCLRIKLDMPSGAGVVPSDACAIHACLGVLCLVYVSACEWYLGVAGWQAPCLGNELQSRHPPSILLQEHLATWAEHSVSCVAYL